MFGYRCYQQQGVEVVHYCKVVRKVFVVEIMAKCVRKKDSYGTATGQFVGQSWGGVELVEEEILS